MRVKKNNFYGIILIIILILIISMFFINRNDNSNISTETVKCIGENSVLYVKEGCSACKAQKDMFGNNYEFLNIIDCVYERDVCAVAGITKIPTWLINGEKLVGVQQLGELIEKTGC